MSERMHDEYIDIDTKNGSAQKRRNARGKSAGHRAARVPQIPTQQRLMNQALHYLKTYAASSGHVHRLLVRRNAKGATHHGLDKDDLRELADETIARLFEAGLLNDLEFAQMKAHSLAREGRSRRGIAGRLQQKSVGREDVAAALDHLAQENPQHERMAAITHARRRRLGPWRQAEARAGRRQRDLAAMARAGFSFALATSVIDAADLEEIEEMIF